MSTLLDVVVPVLVIMVMTVVGMDLRVEHFRRVRDYRVLVPAVVLGQWVLLTLAAGAIVTFLPLTPTVAGGGGSWRSLRLVPLPCRSGRTRRMTGPTLSLGVVRLTAG